VVVKQIGDGKENAVHQEVVAKEEENVELAAEDGGKKVGERNIKVHQQVGINILDQNAELLRRRPNALLRMAEMVLKL